MNIGGGVDPQIIEKIFYTKVIDTPSAVVRDKMIKEGPLKLNAAERRQWAMFVSALLTRHKSMIQKSKEHAKKDLLDALRKTTVTTDGEARFRTQAESEEIINNDLEGFSDGMVQHVSLHAIMNNRLYDFISNSDWHCLDISSSKRELITSDQPITLKSASEEKISLGADPEIIEIAVVALSPSIQFIASTDAKISSLIRYFSKHPREYVSHWNTDVLMRAREFAVAKSDDLYRFVEKHFKRGQAGDVWRG